MQDWDGTTVSLLWAGLPLDEDELHWTVDPNPPRAWLQQLPHKVGFNSFSDQVLLIFTAGQVSSQ